jgi:hypothetical protein
VLVRGCGCVYAGTCVYAPQGARYTRVRCVYAGRGAYIREIVRLRERGVRIRTYLRTRTRCVYAGGCVYASAGCIYAAGAYTHPGAYTRVQHGVQVRFFASGSTYTQRVRIRTPSCIHRFLRIRTPDRVNAGNDKP